MQAPPYAALWLHAGSTRERARVALAGTIISCVALGFMLLAIGVYDEEAGKSERRGGTGKPPCRSVWQRCREAAAFCPVGGSPPLATRSRGSLRSP